MKNKKKVFIFLLFILILVYPIVSFSTDKKSEVRDQNIKVDIDYDKEDRDVGIKRMELLDKLLSPELLEKKRRLIQSIERDYNAKISLLLKRLTPAIANNTVITHIEVNFFDPDFESSVHATQKTSVAVILDRTGRDNWIAGAEKGQDFIQEIKKMIHNTFKISPENIFIVIAPD